MLLPYVIYFRCWVRYHCNYPVVFCCDLYCCVCCASSTIGHCTVKHAG